MVIEYDLRVNIAHRGLAKNSTGFDPSCCIEKGFIICIDFDLGKPSVHKIWSYDLVAQVHGSLFNYCNVTLVIVYMIVVSIIRWD